MVLGEQVVVGYSSHFSGSIRYCAKIEHPLDGAATVFRVFSFSQLGPGMSPISNEL